MCMFCVATPATLAVGANVNARQLRERRNAGERGETIPEKGQVPVGKLTLLATGILVTASVIYHSRFNE